MDCYAFINIFHDRIAKGDLVIKGGKRADPRMRRPEVAMTFFIGHEDPMKEEVENMASSSSWVMIHLFSALCCGGALGFKFLF